MKNELITYPSFESAQALYASYSTIANNIALQNTLLQHIDSSFLSTVTYKNIREAYNQIILKYYPNESCIKAEFIKQMLSKGKSHVTIFELPVGSSRADLCKINGTSIAYEIKTDLDNFSRLNKQIHDYSLIFEQIYVICSQSRVDEVTALLPNNCGIYAYHITTKGFYRFTLIRKATPNQELLSSLKQLQLLRKNEFLTFFSLNPSLNSRDEIISQIMQENSPADINRQFKKILKLRYQKQWDFFKDNYNQILEIDYQWFFKNTVNPHMIYN